MLLFNLIRQTLAVVPPSVGVSQCGHVPHSEHDLRKPECRVLHGSAHRQSRPSLNQSHQGRSLMRFLAPQPDRVQCRQLSSFSSSRTFGAVAATAHQLCTPSLLQTQRSPLLCAAMSGFQRCWRTKAVISAAGRAPDKRPISFPPRYRINSGIPLICNRCEISGNCSVSILAKRAL